MNGDRAGGWGRRYAGPARAGGAAIAIALAGRPVRAEPRACEDGRVDVHGAPSLRWRAAIGRACEELASLTDSDRSARVIVMPVDDDLILEATLADGRSTLRRIKSPGALASALRALFELPIETAAPASASAPALASAPAPASASASTTGTAAEPSPRLGFDLGGSGATRLAGPGPYYSVGLSGFAQLEVGPWGLGADARWESFQWTGGTGPDLEMATLALGLTIARRFRCRLGDLDAGVSPRLVAETQSDSVAIGENTLATTDIRGALFLRAALGHARPLRALVEVDAELSPNRVRRSYRLDPGLPALPAWSAGLAVGFAWAEP